MSDDPAVRRVSDALAEACDWLVPAERRRISRIAVEAARPIIAAEKDQEIHAERMVHALQESRLREGKAPRWEDDPIVLENGWDEGRCGACGEHLPKPAAKPGGNR